MFATFVLFITIRFGILPSSNIFSSAFFVPSVGDTRRDKSHRSFNGVKVENYRRSLTEQLYRTSCQVAFLFSLFFQSARRGQPRFMLSIPHILQTLLSPTSANHFLSHISFSASAMKKQLGRILKLRKRGVALHVVRHVLRNRGDAKRRSMCEQPSFVAHLPRHDVHGDSPAAGTRKRKGKGKITMSQGEPLVAKRLTRLRRSLFAAPYTLLEKCNGLQSQIRPPYI